MLLGNFLGFKKSNTGMTETNTDGLPVGLEALVVDDKPELSSHQTNC